MSYTAKQWRAISHYLKKNNLRPELSAFPVVRFTNKETGEPGDIHISNIEDVYIADREKAKRLAREEAKARKKTEQSTARRVR